MGQFPLNNIFNMDQIPFPFKFLTSRKYDLKRNKTFWQKALRITYTKRQANLQITMSANEKKKYVSLLIIFRVGISNSTIKENQLYNYRVRCIFNIKRYSNELVTLNWLANNLIPASQFPGKTQFLVLDVFVGQKTAQVSKSFREWKTGTLFIPKCFTDLLNYWWLL